MTSHIPSRARVDLYAGIHKGLRACMSETLTSASRMDPDDAVDVGTTLAQVRELIALCRGHLDKEERYIHPAMESRAPGSSRETGGDHVAHRGAFDLLDAAVREVEMTSGPARLAAAASLYRRLALFVAENYEHMDVEETRNNTVLQATHTDEELTAIEATIVASTPPADLGRYLRWMGAGMTPGERLHLLGNIRERAPEAAFEAMVASLRPFLRERDWDKLTSALAFA